MMTGKANILYLQGLAEFDKVISKGICPACLEPIKNHYIDCFKVGKKKQCYIEVRIKDYSGYDSFQCCACNSPLAKMLGLKK
jgi:hypothetical protein